METISQLLLTFLLNAAWQILLIAIIAFLCDWLLLRKTSARIQHMIWVATLILSFGLPVFTSLSSSANTFFESQTIQTKDIQPSFNADTDSIVLGSPLRASDTNSIIPINKNLAIVLCAFYLLFLSFRSIKLLKAWKQTQTIRNKLLLTDQVENLSTIIEECRMVFGVEKVRILYSSMITSPITMGVFNPLIILPEGLLPEIDRNILLSAIGHELVHVKRRDYLFNLLYEFIYLPLSFHPVAALVKRRIKETRELSCDELVADKLLDPEVYARSLVQLAGSAIDLGRKTAITIGILDAGILEKRIMRILKRPKITVYRKSLLLISASVLFVGALVVAISFTIRPVIAQQSSKDDSRQEEKRQVEKEALRRKDLKIIDEKIAVENIYNQQRPDEDQLAKQKAEREMLKISQAELAKLTKITMAEAIDIATKLQPGTVLECKLVFVKAGGESNEAYYAVRVVFDQGKERPEKFIMISATDGKLRVTKLNK